ncbi:MAG: PIN domain nuclease [Spirochaetaceae bacterium]|jgi:predicted nucleic acid-binding protein|nr:PIN domain nuclease [Spirochaetaceae bacterium]
MIVPDSSVWIEYFNGGQSSRTGILTQGLLDRDIATTDIIILESLQGFRSDKGYKEAAKTMDSVRYSEFWGKQRMIQAAANYRLLRRKGITIRRANDIIIATFCIETGHSLLHNDHDFDPMEQYLGLKVVR